MNSDEMSVYTKMYLDGSEIDQGKIRIIPRVSKFVVENVFNNSHIE